LRMFTPRRVPAGVANGSHSRVQPQALQRTVRSVWSP
jgi:hypothetical protein